MFEQVIAAKVATDPTWVDTRRSRSYTWGSPEGVQAVINEMSEESPYNMGLLADDMEALVRALAYVADSDACEGEGGNPADHESGGSCYDTCWRMRASALLSTIAETVGVEWV